MSQEVLQARLGNKFLEYKLRDHQDKVARDEKAQNGGGGGGGGGGDEDDCGEGGGGNGGGSGHHYAATNVSISKSFFGEWEGANTSRSTAKLKLQLGDVDGARADFAPALVAEGKIHSDWAGQAAFLRQRGKLKVMMGEKTPCESRDAEANSTVESEDGGGGTHNAAAFSVQGQAARERLWDDAGADLDSAAAIYSKAQDKDGEASTLAVSAQLKWDRGYATGARACLDNAVALFRYVGNRQGESGCLLKRASFSAEMGQGDEALEDLELALTAFRVIHDAKAEAETLLSMGGVKLQLGLIEAGIGDLESAAAICQRIHNHHLEAKAIQMLVDVKMRLQDVNAAVTNLSCGLACREV
jgi:tetratricopeptide (TPR) repeat protein